MSPKPKASVRLLKARRAAAKELNLPADHWAVKRTALLSVAHENLEQALVEGHRVDISDLLKVEEALNAVKAALPKPPIKVSLEFVDGKTGERSTDLKRPPNKPTGPTQIDGEATEVKPADKPSIDTKPEVEVSPAPAPPLEAERNPSMGAWMRAHGKRYGCPDPGPPKYQGYDNAAPSCFVGSANGQHRDPIPDDPNPQRTIVTPLPMIPKGNGSQ